MTDTYTWKAILKDGSEIDQFENGEENKFSLVEQACDQGLVSEFHLYPPSNSPEFCRCYVDLVNKKLVSITCDRHVDCSSLDGTPTVLYRRRHRAVINQFTHKVISRDMETHLGFKFGAKEIYMTFPNSTNSCDRQLKSKGIDLESVQMVSGLP